MEGAKETWPDSPGINHIAFLEGTELSNISSDQILANLHALPSQQPPGLPAKFNIPVYRTARGAGGLNALHLRSVGQS